jgi:hypothetical protein
LQEWVLLLASDNNVSSFFVIYWLCLQDCSHS